MKNHVNIDVWRERARVTVLTLTALAVTWCAVAGQSRSYAATTGSVKSTEEFLNHLGVNTHLDGLTGGDPWNTNAIQVAEQLRYIGVRLDRDWLHSPESASQWNLVQNLWGRYGRFWSSIDETSPAHQREDLKYTQRACLKYPHMFYALGGPNEEDNSYPISLGASLPDSALVQKLLYQFAHSHGRNIPVSQMEFGSGWTSANGWQGDYNPTNTGIHQNYVPGPADFGGAHTYMHQPGQTPRDVLAQVRLLAQTTTPQKPVAHTEFGAYHGANLSDAEFGRYVVIGALDSFVANDAAYIVYGLQDSAPEGTYGFFNFPSGKPHEAAVYYHNLTSLLSAKHGGYGPGTKEVFVPGRIAVSYSNISVSHLELQKPTREFVLCLWSEQVTDKDEHNEIDTLRFNKPPDNVNVYDIETGMTPTFVASHCSSLTLTLKPNDVYVILVHAKAPGPVGYPNQRSTAVKRKIGTHHEYYKTQK